LIAAGRTNREAGDELGLAEKTVRNYTSTIFDKLNVARRCRSCGVPRDTAANALRRLTGRHTQAITSPHSEHDVPFVPLEEGQEPLVGIGRLSHA
jgi:Bacterial regulatory proteins, luxR family